MTPKVCIGDARVIPIERARAKYLAPPAPADPFLADAATSCRILWAALSVPECAVSDLRALHRRLCESLRLYVGADPLADKLRRDAIALDAAITARR